MDSHGRSHLPASQLAPTSGPVRGKSFIRLRIKSAGPGVALDRGVELLRVEYVEPRAKSCKLARIKAGTVDYRNIRFKPDPYVPTTALEAVTNAV